MSIQSLLKRITGFQTKASTRAVSYEALFKGAATAPPTNNFLPGLRPVEYDVDTYFKDVFAGPVF
jgi:hypothetical protein